MGHGDGPSMKVQTFTQLFTEIGVILNHEPYNHDKSGENPSWVGHFVVKGHIDRVGVVRLSSNNSLPTDGSHTGEGSTFHDSYVMKVQNRLDHSMLYTGRETPGCIAWPTTALQLG